MLASLAVFATASPVSAVGYWNLPGTVCQCSGYGYGPGHHAKFVLGPITHHGCLANNEVRLPYAPQPPYGYYGCYDCGNDFGQSSVLAPSATQATEPMIAPQESLPTPLENEIISPSLEPEPVELESEAPPTSEAPSELPPPPPLVNPPARPLFDAPVEP